MVPSVESEVQMPREQEEGRHVRFPVLKKLTGAEGDLPVVLHDDRIFSAVEVG
jgi:hypothetical protein